jgi:hypothetical protein
MHEMCYEMARTDGLYYRQPEGEVVSEGAVSQSPPRSEWLIQAQGGVSLIIHRIETIRYSTFIPYRCVFIDKVPVPY